MPVFNIQEEPIGFMSFVTNSDCTKVEIAFPAGMDWHETIAHLTNNLNTVLKGRFVVMLGNERKLTDTSAEFIIRTEDPDDLAFVRAYLSK